MTPDLSIITALPKGHHDTTIWQWYKEKVLAGVTYEILDVSQPCAPRGKRILLMGSKPLSMYHANQSLFTARGTLLSSFNRPAMATFDVQDAYDFKPADEDKNEEAFGKDRAATRKSNWLFWIEQDTRKLLGPLGAPQEFRTVIAPDIRKVIHLLSHTHDSLIYLDIETDMDSDTLSCIGLAVNDDPVVVVPVYSYTHKLYYDRAMTMRFLAVLASSLVRNTAVVHNAMFDLLYLASHYRLPFGRRIHDTMVMQKRRHPAIEKSLGHCISLYTWQPWHKDEGSQAKGAESQERLWRYNAKDVGCTRLVYKAQMALADKDTGYAASIAQANDSIYPYIIATLHGVRTDIMRLSRDKQVKDKRIAQLERIIRRLIGNPVFNPASTKQLVDYFHKTLCYEVQETTGTGAPSLAGKALYKLALKYDNPLIPAILTYRAEAKERSMMDFINWRLPWNEI